MKKLSIVVMACILLLLFSMPNQSTNASTMPDGLYINGATKKFFSVDYLFNNVDIVVEEINNVESLRDVYFYQANTVLILEDAFEGQDFIPYVDGMIPAGSYIQEYTNGSVIVGSEPIRTSFKIESIY